MTPGESFELMRTAARAFERDRYVAALLSPRSARPDLIALAAFLGDVSRIPATVDEPMIGEIRLQWWRDALNASGGETSGGDSRPAERSGHPIADAICDLIRRHDLPPALFQGIIDCQSLLLYDEPPADALELRQQLLKSQSAAFEIAARVLDGPIPSADLIWLQEAGVAYGYARTAFEFAAVLAQGRTLAPQSILTQHRTSLGDLHDGHSREAGQQVLAWLVGEARAGYDNLRRQRSARPRAVRRACLPMAMVPAYCHALEKAGLNALTTRVEVAPILPFVRLWLAAF